MFQRVDEHSLLVFRLLARSDVQREPLEAYEAPDVIEFGRSRFLKPYFPAIRMPEAEGGHIGRALGTDTAHHGLEVLAVVRMDAREKAARGKRLPRVKSQDLRRVIAAQRRTRGRVPNECRDRPCRQGLLQTGFALRKRGLVLAALGERESDTTRLEEAVAAFRAALTERTRERVPLQWAGTQNNFGVALATLGERKNDTAQLEEAVAACRAALTEYTRERAPLEWAMTQDSLGSALVTLGKRESDTACLEEAVAACRAALTERTRERVPLRWATTQHNLGNALRRLGERESDTARLKETVAAYDAALTERTRERAPHQWARSTGDQGIALMMLAGRTGDVSMARTAVSQIGDALATVRAGGDRWAASNYEEQLSKANEVLAKLSKHRLDEGGC